MNDSGYKGFNYPLKGIVTSIDDPANLNRIQVYIPNYHGKRDPSREGPVGSYPWAQVNTLIQRIEETGSEEQEANSSTGGSFLSRAWNKAKSWLSGVANTIFVSDEGKGFENIAPPEVGDVVWLIFEGGDIRCPVYFGTAAVPKNAKDRVISDTGAVGSYGDSYQGADGSYGYTYEFAGGSPVDMVISVIYGEKDYTKIFPGSGNISMSLGYIDALAMTGDAERLLQDIYNKNQSLYRDLCNQHYGQFIDPNKSWRNQTLPAGNRLTNAIKVILNSATGREAQDEYAYKEISKCIASGRSIGITDPTALTFYCDVYHTMGSGAESLFRDLPSKTLDDLYEASKNLNGYDGSKAYSKVQELISQGQFVKKVTTTLSEGSDTYVEEAPDNNYLAWPVPSSRNVTVHFSENHKGIDIKASANAQVVAAHDGKVAKATKNNEFGNYIELEWSEDTKTVYKHLNIMKVQQGNMVKRGTTIGAVGMTGNATGYHLHYEVIIHNSYKDPEAMSYGSNSTSTGSSSYSSGGNILDETGIWNAIIALGYNRFATAAIMGNMMAESALRSNNAQDEYGFDDNWYTNAVDSGTYSNFTTDSVGYGLCQWTIEPRKSKLLNFARNKNVSISNARMQITFMHLEMINDYPQVHEALLSATSVVNPSNMILTWFENPQVKPYEYRQQLSIEILNRHSN